MSPLPNGRPSRWESIPNQQNPRFPRNTPRAKRDAPRPVRRLSSGRTIPDAAIAHIQNELKQIDPQPEGGKRRSLLDGMLDAKFLFERRCSFIVVRRSTERTSCSDITVDSDFFSEDEEEDYEDDISEEQSLVEDDDEDNDEPEQNTPTILILAMEPYESSAVVNNTRVVAKQVRKEFGPDKCATKKVAVDTVDVLFDSQAEDDSRNSHNILTMAAIKRHIQRTQPQAVVIITEDSLESGIAVEAYDSTESKKPSRQAVHIVDDMKIHSIPTTSEPIYGPEIYQQWVTCLHKVGLQKDSSITFLHMPPREGSVLEEEALVNGTSLAISRLASGLIPQSLSP